MFNHCAQSAVLTQRAAELGVTLSAAQAAQFTRYAELLEEWNAHVNLTRVPPEDYVPLHFLDSLSVFGIRYSVFGPATEYRIPSTEHRLLDVGTGAGFPGLPLKIAFPELDVTLLDATKKKLDFLDAVIAELGLAGVRTLHSRAEELGKEKAHRERYDVVVARAVSAMNVLAEWLLPLVKVGGAAVAMKSVEAEAEIEGAAGPVKLLGGRIEKVERLTVPGTEIERLLAVIRKERPTPLQYPRPGTIITQRPLK